MSKVGSAKRVELVLQSRRMLTENKNHVILHIPLTEIEKRTIGIDHLSSPSNGWALRVIVDKVLA
jgi:hypothetical protein